MYKQILTLTIVVLLLSVAVAGIVLSTDKTISSDRINATEKAELESLNVSEWSYKDNETSIYVFRKLDFGENRFHVLDIKRYYDSCANWTVKTEIVMDDGTATEETFKECNEVIQVEKTAEEKTAELDELEINFVKYLAKTIRERDNPEIETTTRDGSVVISNR